jgi:nucleotide-binding universal stress UspA family protein
MTQAPDFTLQHMAGHQVSLSQFRGTPVVLIISGKGASEQAKQIGQTLEDRYLDRVRVVSVLDMSGVPKLARPIANKMVERGYNEAVRDTTAKWQQAGRPVPANPADVVVFLKDPDGAVARSLGLTGVEDDAAAVVVGADGTLLSHARGAGAADQIAGALQ